MVAVVVGVVPSAVGCVFFDLIRPSHGWISVAFGEEIDGSVLKDFAGNSVNYRNPVGVVWVVEDDNVAVWVVAVKCFGVNTLNHYEVAHVKCPVKRVRPTVAGGIIGDTHAAAGNDVEWKGFCVQNGFRTVPEAKDC